MDNLGGRIERPALNPGHHIHVDEWVSSPFFENSEIELKSGMMMQMDIIPVVQNGGFGANAEDGIVLADAELRGQLQRMEPQFMQRVENRRNYMKEQIGIALDESVLPLSDIQGWVPPLLLNPGLAMRRV